MLIKDSLDLDNKTLPHIIIRDKIFDYELISLKGFGHFKK